VVTPIGNEISLFGFHFVSAQLNGKQGLFLYTD
jgi:hypothetical protein